MRSGTEYTKHRIMIVFSTPCAPHPCRSRLLVAGSCLRAACLMRRWFDDSSFATCLCRLWLGAVCFPALAQVLGCRRPCFPSARRRALRFTGSVAEGPLASALETWNATCLRALGPRLCSNNFQVLAALNCGHCAQGLCVASSLCRADRTCIVGAQPLSARTR